MCVRVISFIKQILGQIALSLLHFPCPFIDYQFSVCVCRSVSDLSVGPLDIFVHLNTKTCLLDCTSKKLLKGHEGRVKIF